MASRTPKPFSLRLVLIVPYVVLVIALAVALGVLSYSAGSGAVATVSEHLLIEAVSRITQAVDRHIVGSGAVLESAFPDGMAAPRSIEADFHELRTRLWIATTLHTDPNDYVYYGNEAGQALGLYRRSAEVAELRMKLKEDEKRAIYSFEGIDGALQFERRETRLFDPRTRPWYADGRKAAGHTWTSVYIDFGSRQLVATRARQVRSASGAFEGVVATDVSLRALNEFVGRLEVSRNGVAFIIEPDGNLIASSASPNVVTLADGSSGRLNAASSEHPLVKAAYVTVRDQLALRDKTQQPQAFSFDNENGHLVQAAFDRIRDDAGLDWVMVVAMPASDFLGNVTENVTRSIVLAGLAVLIVIVIGLSILGWVSRDLRRLSEVARRVGHGELDAPVGIHRQDEIGELARSFEAMQQHLRTDKLTGLANRDALLQQLRRRIERAREDRRSPPLAVLFIDLNRFKQINDRYGHDAGDLALQEIAERLRASVRAEDTVARYAGDEFVILVDRLADRAALEQIRRNIDAVLRRPLDTVAPDDGIACAGGAIGAALYPDDGEDAEALLKHADRSMYQDKFGHAGADTR